MDEKESGMGATHKEEKMSRQNDADLPESKDEEINTLNLKRAEIREYNHFKSSYMIYHCNFHGHKHNFILIPSLFPTRELVFLSFVFRTFSCYRNDRRERQWETGAPRDDPCLQSTCPSHGC